MHSRFGDTSVYSCDLCGIIFNDMEELEWHIGKRHNYRCSRCSFTFDNTNNYVGTWQQWVVHMITEHELKATSVPEVVSGRVTQWTFRISF